MSQPKFGQAALPDANSNQITVLDPTIPGGTESIRIKNNSAANKMYLGHTAGFAVVDGYELAAGESVLLEILSPNKIYIRGTLADVFSWAAVIP